MFRPTDPFWILAAAATASTAAAISVSHAVEGLAGIPPSAVKPPPGSPGSSSADASQNENARPSPGAGGEDCEASGWNAGSFVGGLAIGVVVTFLGALMPAIIMQRRAAKRPEPGGTEAGQAEEAGEWGNAGREVFRERAEKRLEADPALRRKTDPTHELPVKRPDASAHRGCTDDVESMHLFWPRAGFLVAMLLVQSISSLILEGFEGLIQHTDLVLYLTMIAGLGGNAGGQSMVLAVRGLAVGKQILVRDQLLRGLQLSVALVPVAYFRVKLSGGSFAVCWTVALSCLAVLVTSTSSGTAIPRILLAFGVDPAHGATIIQVLMDIGGIAIVCAVAIAVLGV